MDARAGKLKIKRSQGPLDPTKTTLLIFGGFLILVSFWGGCVFSSCELLKSLAKMGVQIFARHFHKNKSVGLI